MKILRVPREGHLLAEQRQDRWRHGWTLSSWSTMLDNGATLQPTSWVGRKFRRKFRVPREIFDKLVEESME